LANNHQGNQILTRPGYKQQNHTTHVSVDDDPGKNNKL